MVWLAETSGSLADFGAAFHSSVTTVFGQGDASYVRAGGLGDGLGCLDPLTQATAFAEG